MRADNSRHIVDAARRRSAYIRAKAIQALRTLDAAGDPVTFKTVANQAGVSRSWLYVQPDLRAEIEQLRTAHRRAPAPPVPARQRATDASLQRRLEAATAEIRRLRQENHRLRDQLAHALGERRAAAVRPATRTSSNLTGPC